MPAMAAKSLRAPELARHALVGRKVEVDGHRRSSSSKFEAMMSRKSFQTRNSLALRLLERSPLLLVAPFGKGGARNFGLRFLLITDLTRERRQLRCRRRSR